MSWWKSRRSLDASLTAIPRAISTHSLQDISSHEDHSLLPSTLRAGNWNNESSTSLPTYAEAIGVYPDKDARKQKLATFLHEMQYDEELRLTEARKPPSLPSETNVPQSDHGNQISLIPDLTASHNKDTLKLPPVLPSFGRRHTLTSIDEASDLFPEPEALGPKTSCCTFLLF